MLDPDGTGDPTEAEISILVQGDDSPTGRLGIPALSLASLNEIHQPDNLETTMNGNLLVTEDPSSANQYDAGSLNSTAARLWKVPLSTADRRGKMPLLAVNQALDENTNAALGAIDVDRAQQPRGSAPGSRAASSTPRPLRPRRVLPDDPGALVLDRQKLAGPDMLDAAGSPPETTAPTSSSRRKAAS